MAGSNDYSNGDDLFVPLDRAESESDNDAARLSPRPRGRGVSKWRNGEVESALSGSRGPCYSKNDLLNIYDTLQHQTRLTPPPGAKIPMTLRKEGPRVGINELSCTEWIWIAAADLPYSTLDQKTVHARLRDGQVAPDDILLPMSVIKMHGIRGSEFGKVFAEQTDAKKMNLRNAAKEEACAFGSSAQRTFCETDWHELSAALDCNEVCYLDSSSNLQGPFDKRRILQWWKHGYFPVHLQIRPSETEHFVLIDLLLAKWFAEEDLWHIQHNGVIDPYPIFRNDLIDRFCSQQLEIDACALPVCCHDAKRSIRVLYLMVHWLPFSETLLVKEASEVESMSIKDAFDLWLQEYRTQPGYLTVRPESWNNVVHFYIPIEKLMESYGFVE